MKGYHPNYNFLKSAGLKILQNKDMMPVFDENTHQTNVKGIYLAGLFAVEWKQENDLLKICGIGN
jgi:thioredoxin reductase (NADPH)